MQKHRRKIWSDNYEKNTSDYTKTKAINYAFPHGNFYSEFREFPSNSSATIRVAARLIPELAKVIANVYTDIISSKIPRAFTAKFICYINAKKDINTTHKKRCKC